VRRRKSDAANHDEGELAIAHNYANCDIEEQRQLFRERRTALIEFLQARQPHEWQRTANRPEIGLVTLEAMVLLLPLHDTYHLSQIAQWRSVR
jgi:hypothetical protein